MVKKVLIVITTPFDGYGITVVAKNYCKCLKDFFKFDFLLCSGYDEKELNFLHENNFGVFFAKYSRLRHPIRYSKWLSSFIKNGHYDCVHVHGNSGTMYFDIHAAKKANVAIRIAHCHNSSCNYKLVHYILKPFLNKEITCGLACSKVAGDWLFSKDFVVLNNAIDSDVFKFSQVVRKQLREEFKVCKDKVLLNVGRLHPQKNPLFLMEIMNKLVLKDPSYKLFMVGDGELWDEVNERVKKYNLLNNVFLIEKRSDVNFFYSFADLFVFPSVYEGLGIVVIEAQASGLQVIASSAVPKETNVSNVVEFVDLEIDQWVDKIEAFFTKNEADRNELSKRSINLIKEKYYDINTNCEILKSIYHKVGK